MSLRGKLITPLALVAALSLALFGIVTGTIRGRVTDASGAAIPGAAVKVVNLQTGFTRSVPTNAHGEYAVLALPPGQYDVTVTKPGFKTFTQNKVNLTVGQTFVANAALSVGSVSQTVEVNASAVQINTTNAQLGTTVDTQQIEQLPLIGRNWFQLQLLQPGVVSSSDRFGTFSTNGNRTQANDFLMNGTSFNDFELNTQQVTPSEDSISQFRMATSVMDAQYGHNSGATISAYTKNGTNEFHGSAFEYYRDTSLNAADFFLNAVPRVTPNTPPQRAPFHQNEYGGTIGGPILHNKTFFFFSYEGLQNKTGSAQTTTVFTPGQRNGVWGSALQTALAGEMSTFGDNQVSPRAMYGDVKSPCPVSGGTMCPAGTTYASLFSTGTIPTQDMDPLAVKLMNEYVPSGVVSSGGVANDTFSTANTASDNQYIWRLDQDFGAGDQLSFVGHWETNPTNETLPFTGADLPGFPEVDTFHFQDYVLSETHVFSPTLLNQIHLAYLRQNFGAVEPVTSAAPSSYGFQNINPQITQGESMPVVGVSGYFTLGFSNNGPQPRIEQVPSLTDNVSWIDGAHSFKFGVDIRHPQTYNPFAAQNNGSFSFSGAGPYSTGLAPVDFLLGLPDTYSQEPGGVTDASAWESYLYAQDEWHMTPNFTLTLGTGWQISTPWTNAYYGGEGVVGWRPGQQSTVFPTAPEGLVYPGDPGMTPAGYSTHYDDFAPVGAFAWGFRPGWSLRGGYGLFFNATEEETALQTMESPPFGTDEVVHGGEFANPFLQYTASGPTAVANQFPFAFPTPGQKVNFASFEPMSIAVMDPHFNLPYNENFNLTLQRQLAPTAVLTLSYVGSYGRHLESVMELNPENAQECLAMAGCNISNEYQYNVGAIANPLVINSLGDETNLLNSTYSAFEAELRKSFSHGFLFQTSYTWSHATDYGSSFEGAWGGSSGALDPSDLAYTYGNSDYDQPQRLVMSYIYDIPGPQFAKLLTNGWEVSGITTFQAGFPITVVYPGGSPALECPAISFFGCWDRPNQVSGITFYTNPRSAPGNEWFGGNAFAPQTTGTLGDSPRNSFFGPGLANYDFSLMKNMSVGEGKNLQLRGEFYNVFNHENFASPDNYIETPEFGDITSTAGNPRNIQLAVRITF
ncbi:MAG: carboxypeptidase regulatory-like domain-containing protein [Terriglobales bacterium]